MERLSIFRDLWNDANWFLKIVYIIGVPLLLFTVFAVIHTLMFVDHGQSVVRDQVTTEDHFWAETACKDSVDKQLISPATADYDVTSSKELRDGVWYVAGTVDAENSLGAKIRGHWTCNAERSSGDNWTAIATLN